MPDIDPEPFLNLHQKPQPKRNENQGWRDPDGRLQFWKNVHGLDYSSMADLPLDEASVEVVGRSDMVTERCLCRDFNHETVEDEVRGDKERDRFCFFLVRIAGRHTAMYALSRFFTYMCAAFKPL